MTARSCNRIIIPVVLLVCATASATDSLHFISFNGTIGLHYGAYGSSASNYSEFHSPYPQDLGRLSAQATFKAGEYFSVPIGVDITTRTVAYTLPTVPAEGVWNYIQNPQNNIHIDPAYKWAKAFLGTQTASYSALTTGDIPLFGLGVELTPGPFLFSLNYGKSQQGIEYDSLNVFSGVYEQNVLAARMGVGKEDGNQFVLNFVHLDDNPASIQPSSGNQNPVEAVTVSPIIRLKFAERVRISQEIAGSVFTHDKFGPELPIDNTLIDIASDIIAFNATSNADIASVSAIDWETEAVRIGAQVRYVGPGYYSAGYRFFENDLVDYSLKTGFALFDNAVQVDGSAGLRMNNLQGTTIQPSSRFIGQLNINSRFSESFSLGASYANFGVRSSVLFDTIRTEVLQNMFSISPGLTLNTAPVTHTISASGSLKLFDEYTIVNEPGRRTQSASANASYFLAFKEFPLTTGLSGMFLDNRSAGAGFSLSSVSLTGRYSLLSKKLVPSIMLSYAGMSRGGYTPDNRFKIQVKTKYAITQTTDSEVSYVFTTLAFGSAKPGAVTREHRVQVFVGQSF